MKKTTILLAALSILSLAGNGVLGILLYRSKTVGEKAVKVKAWKSCRKLSMQHLLYDRAQERARREGKKLVVIGNPSGGYVNKVVRVYGCGDLCIDIAGCSPCGPESRVLKDDAIRALRTLPDDSAVVFESEVFEYVGDMQDAVKELDRVTGGDHTRIYSVHAIAFDPWPYHMEGVAPAKPSSATLDKRRKERHKYAQTGEGMAKRIIYRFPPRHRYAWTEL
ncbi:MAG: hypothetical protein RBU30_23200 [Polyangia bacterium]|jgi:hypothetical protein|nr:hypothetical protein [Polyangia bacterium]